ncbi:MAG: hypothetical protein ACUVQ9_13540 [Thermodesulfobacteriota bacterium]
MDKETFEKIKDEAINKMMKEYLNEVDLSYSLKVQWWMQLINYMDL